MLLKASQAVGDALSSGLRPDPILTVSEWADRHRRLSQRAAAEPGQWRTSRTPYLREIMDELSVTSATQEVWFMKGAQIGATETGNNWIGYVIDNAPGPMLAVQPTLDMQKRNVRTRIDPMLTETPRLAEKVATARSRDGGNSQFSKDFPGGVLILTGANSATGLRSMPARYLFLDEVDAYPGDLDGEGDPLDLARARARTYKRRKLFYVSTPTFHGRSKIEAGFEQSDKRYYHVPCPHCGHYQHLRWSNVVYDKDDTAKPAQYMCEECGALIDEHEKTGMLAKGEYRATAKAKKPGTVGFHVNSLYSPLGWYSWSDARDDFMAAQGNPEKLRAFVNTVLGETWAEKGDAPEWRRLYDRREHYTIGTVPEGGIVLTMAADVQKDRIEAEVIAWGPRMEHWSVDYRILPGDTAALDDPGGCWEAFGNLMRETFRHENGAELGIQLTAVDAGYNTQIVYDFCRRFPRSTIIPVMGNATQQQVINIPRLKDVNRKGRKVKGGVQAWNVGTNHVKAEVYGWLKQDMPLDDAAETPHGYCHFPQYDAEYFEQLTAEQLVMRVDKKGYRKYIWEQTRLRNEALDTHVYNRAAAYVLGVDRWNEDAWAERKAEIDAMADSPAGDDNDDDEAFSLSAMQPKKRRTSDSAYL